MRVAAFKSAPYASHVADILQDQGYETEVIDCDGANAARARDLAEAVTAALWARAFLVTNCEGEYLKQIVPNFFGQVIWMRRPRAMAG